MIPFPKPNPTAMKLHRSLLLVLSLLLLATGPRAHAQAIAGAPNKIDYQGKVLDSADAALAPTTPTNYTMLFRIYDSQSAGNLLWTEQQIVTVDKGLFSVRLGEGTTYLSETRPDLSTVFNGSDRFVGLTVAIPAGSAISSAVEITPRLTFLSAPFAFSANRAKLADTVTSSSGSSLSGTAGQPVTIGGAVTATGATFSGGTFGTVAAPATFTGSGTFGSATSPATFVGNGAGLTNVPGAIPIGGIILWSGTVATIPAGWALCNGQIASGRTTPNLMDRFIVGAGSAYNPGATGGASSVTLSTNNLPSFNVSIKTGSYGYPFSLSNVQQFMNAPGAGPGAGIVTTTTAQTFPNNSFDIRPPYYALAYIMRVQ